MISPAPKGTLAVKLVQVMVLAAAGALFVAAFMVGIAKQQEIEERKLPDLCRAQPARCDVPDRHGGGR